MRADQGIDWALRGREIERSMLNSRTKTSRQGRDKADFQSNKLKVRSFFVAHVLTEVMHFLQAIDRRRDTLHPGLYLQREKL